MGKGRKCSDGRFGRRLKHILTKEVLEDLYTKQGKTPYEIAKQMKCSARSVYTFLDYYKIARIDFNGIRITVKENMRFGKLVTIKEDSRNHYGIKWLCQCDCGKTAIVQSVRLSGGNTTSCGCYRTRTGENHHLWTGYCDISGHRVSQIKKRAEKIKKDFNLTAKFLWELFEKQNGICAISGLKIDLFKDASLDRIDSNMGYVEGNVWWTHKDINKMKMDLDLTQFLQYCKIIAEYNGVKND